MRRTPSVVPLLMQVAEFKAAGTYLKVGEGRGGGGPFFSNPLRGEERGSTRVRGPINVAKVGWVRVRLLRPPAGAALPS